MSSKALGIIFSNMHDELLQELTNNRTMGSVPYGGRYRLIDFVLSNMYNSGITKVGVITKSNYQSLMDHLGSGKEWDMSHKREGLYILPPFGRSQSGVYKSRLEALSGIYEFIHKSVNEYVIMADCDEINNMDYNVPLDFHIKNNADITAIYHKRLHCKETCRGDVGYTVSRSGRVTDVEIDPDIHEEEESCKATTFNCGLNTWIIRKSVLEQIIKDAVSHGLESWERDVLQKRCLEYRMFGWELKGYSGHICSMSSFFKTNMDLLDDEIKHELFYRHGHIYTKIRDEVPAKYGKNAVVSNSFIADGCVIEGEVENCVLFRGVYIGRGAKVSNSIIMQSSRVEDNVKLNCVIIDKDVFVKENRILMGYESYPLFIGKGSVV